MTILVNIDVPDLDAAIRFYTAGFGLSLDRRLGSGAAELGGWPVKVYLLEQPEGSVGAGADPRRYSRHWCPVHLDVVVEDVDASLVRALAAGAVQETPVRDEVWGRIVTVSDP